MQKLLNRYETITELGRGAMGVVYLAHDTVLNRKIAIKVLSLASNADSPDIQKKRLLKEAQILAKIDHPNVVKIFDIFIGESESFICMEFVNGKTLRQFFQDDLPLMSFEEKLKIAKQIMSGLKVIHQSIIAHRDLKPSNIIIDKINVLKIMDFGISKEGDETLSAADMILGSPSYMSPEQVQADKDIDQRSDIFSLGIILHELFLNENPFVASSLHLVFNNILIKEVVFDQDLPDNSLPKQIYNIIEKCLQKNKLERYQSIAEIENDFDMLSLTPSTLPTSNLKPVKSFHIKNSNQSYLYSWASLTFSTILFLISVYFYISRIHLPKSHPIQSYHNLLGICGDQICTDIEKFCPGSCPSDCHGAVEVNIPKCQELIGKKLQLVKNQYPQFTCGDEICTFVEERCALCEKDCKSTNSGLNYPACQNLFNPIRNSKSNENNIKALEVRTIYDNCYFKINRAGIIPSSFTQEMLQCLFKAPNSHINSCKIKFQNLRFEGPMRFASSFFECVIKENPGQEH